MEPGDNLATGPGCNPQAESRRSGGRKRAVGIENPIIWHLQNGFGTILGGSQRFCSQKMRIEGKKNKSVQDHCAECTE